MSTFTQEIVNYGFKDIQEMFVLTIGKVKILTKMDILGKVYFIQKLEFFVYAKLKLSQHYSLINIQCQK